MSSPASSPSGEPSPPDETSDLPLPLSSSVILTTLPSDARGALASVSGLDAGKVTIRFKPLPSAPALRQSSATVSASKRFETVVQFLRKKLKVRDAESVFCYVRQVFAPGLDEGVGNLLRCFGTAAEGGGAGKELVVWYSVSPAFG